MSDKAGNVPLFYSVREGGVRCGHGGQWECALRRCDTIKDAVAEVMRIVEKEKRLHPDDDAEFFFRGVKRNWEDSGCTTAIGTSFQSCLDRKRIYVEHERDLYQEALRYNVASFTDDRTMTDRIVRMQHYQLPTRFADVSTNFLQGLLFAVGGCDPTAEASKKHDGFVRVIKVARHKMKSFTSDIIVAISHLPLVDCPKVNPGEPGGLDTLRYEIMKERPAFGLESERPKEAARLREEIKQVWAFKPKLNNDRIRNQGGLFLAFGCLKNKESLHPTFSPKDFDVKTAPSYGIKQIGAVQIAAEAKSRILGELRMFGMQEEVVYPDISNVCQTISKLYK